MASWVSTGLWPASLCSCSCDSCRATHGSASGDGTCPHQQPPSGMTPQNCFDYANDQSVDVGAGAGTGAGADLVAYADPFDQQQYNQASSYPQNIVYDLSPPDGNSWSQAQPRDNFNDYTWDSAGGNRTAFNQNNYYNNQQHASYQNGTGSHSSYRTAQVSHDAGSSSGQRTTHTRARVTDAENYYNSEDDRIITDRSGCRSNRHPFTHNRLRQVRKIIRDAETRFDNPHHYNSS